MFLEVDVPWREVSVVSQRGEFVRLAEAGVVSFAELCRRFGISRETGYVWLRRFRAEGDAGLIDRSCRPHSHPGRTPDDVEALVCATRRAHPAWGGRKIRGFLLRQGHLGVPAASTITQILRRNNLVTPVLAQPRAYQRFQAALPNRLWQMDFKGWLTVTSGQRVHPFGILDDYSRFNLSLDASLNQQTATVQRILTNVFHRYGLPDRMLMDNGAPWGNDRSHPWTPLTVWLCDLGIVVSHIRPYRPQTQGKQERFHRTLALEVLNTRPRWETPNQLQDAFDSFRTLYNHHRPHEALGETIVPADRYQPSTRSLPNRIDPPHYPDNAQLRRVTTGGRISYRNQRYRVGKAFTGKQVAITPTTTDGIFHVTYRHHHIRTINLSGTYPNTRQEPSRS